MLRLFRYGLIPAILLIAGLAPAVRPLAADPLAAISRDAGLVVRLKNPRQTVEKLAVLADAVFPILGTQIRAQSGMLGAAIANPTLAGVDDRNDWWLAVFPHGRGQDPDLLFLIPAIDIGAMKKAIGSKQRFIEQGSLGIYTDDADTAERTASLLAGAGKSIASMIDAESRAVIDRGDLSVYFNLTRLTSAYRAELQDLQGLATENIEGPLATAIAALGSDTPAAADRAAAELLAQLADAVTQGLEDSPGFSLALTVSAEGIATEGLLRVAAGSKTEKLLGGAPSGPLAALGSLPAGGLGYLGLTGGWTGLMQSSFRQAAALADEDETSAKAARSALGEMQQLKHPAIASSFALGSVEQGAFRSVTISEVDDPARERALTAKLYEAVATAQARRPRPTFELKAGAEQHGPHAIDLLKTADEAALGPDPVDAAIARRKTRVLYGPEGNVRRFVYLKDRIVQTTGGGEKGLDEALAALDQPAGRVGESVPFKQTRAQLGDRSSLLVLLDLPSTFARVIETAIDSGEVPIPFDRDAIRNLLLKPSYMGLSLANEPQAVFVRATIPAEQLRGLARIGMLVASLLEIGR